MGFTSKVKSVSIYFTHSRIGTDNIFITVLNRALWEIISLFKNVHDKALTYD